MVTAKSNSYFNVGTPSSPNVKRKNAKGTRKPYTKRACTNCKNAHAACEPTRPCKRCVNMGIPHECIDAERKKPTRPRQRKNKKNENDASSVAVTNGEFMSQTPYNVAFMGMPGTIPYSYPPFPNIPFAQYPYTPMIAGAPTSAPIVGANTSTPLYTNGEGSSSTSPQSPSTNNTATNTQQTAQSVNILAPPSQQLMIPYAMMPPMVMMNQNNSLWQENQGLHPQMYFQSQAYVQVGATDGIIETNGSQSKRNKKKNVDDSEEEESAFEDDEFDEDGDVCTNDLDEAIIKTEGENISNQYDVTTPSDSIFQLDSPPASPHNSITAVPYDSPVDDSINTSSALALQVQPQQLQLHIPNVVRYPYNDSLFDDIISPTSPLHQRPPAKKLDDKEEIIDLITENAATMLEDQDKSTTASKMGTKNKGAINNTRSNAGSSSNNTSLVQVNDALWSQLMADMFKDDNKDSNGGADTWPNADSSALDTTDINAFGLSNLNGTVDRAPRKATLTQEQLEQLLKHVWDKQMRQTEEIKDLKMELKRVVQEMETLSFSQRANGSMLTQKDQR